MCVKHLHTSNIDFVQLNILNVFGPFFFYRNSKRIASPEFCVYNTNRICFCLAPKQCPPAPKRRHFQMIVCVPRTKLKCKSSKSKSKQKQHRASGNAQRSENFHHCCAL